MVATDLYVFFYTGPFSNWHRAPFTIDEITFSHGEQWMMYRKAKLFGDDQTAEKILQANHPRDQKRLGREVRGFDPQVWERENIGLMVPGLRERFLQHPHDAKLLIDTHPLVLVEASPTDTIWGVGLAIDDPLIRDRRNWRGENRLGRTLMLVRQYLRFQQHFV